MVGVGTANEASLCDLIGRRWSSETLTIAGVEKAKDRSLEQDLHLLCSTNLDCIMRKRGSIFAHTVDSITAQPMPMEIDAVVSTCGCCGKKRHGKLKCQMRDGCSGKPVSEVIDPKSRRCPTVEKGFILTAV